jgi:hypothetical protein
VKNILEIADELTSADRPAVYGRALEDYECTAAMWNAILHKANPSLPPGVVLVTPELAVAMMAAMKLSRFAAVAVREVLEGELTEKHMDSLVDGAGYLRMVQIIKSQRDARHALDTFEPAPMRMRGHSGLDALLITEAIMARDRICRECGGRFDTHMDGCRLNGVKCDGNHGLIDGKPCADPACWHRDRCGYVSVGTCPHPDCETHGSHLVKKG